jgi:hypothetical protein
MKKNKNSMETAVKVVVKQIDSTEECTPFEGSPVEVRDPSKYIGQEGLAKPQERSKGDQPGKWYDVTFADGAVGTFKKIELEFWPVVSPRNIVSFQLANQLFEGGFNEPCIQYYGRKSCTLYGNDWLESETKLTDYNNQPGHDDIISAPTVEQANEWLAKKNVELENKLKELERQDDIGLATLHITDIKVDYLRQAILDSDNPNKVERTLFEIAQQANDLGEERAIEAFGPVLTKIAMKLFPGVDVNSKFVEPRNKWVDESIIEAFKYAGYTNIHETNVEFKDGVYSVTSRKQDAVRIADFVKEAVKGIKPSIIDINSKVCELSFRF